MSSEECTLALLTGRSTSSIRSLVSQREPSCSTTFTCRESSLPLIARAMRPRFRACSWRFNRSRTLGSKVFQKASRRAT